YQADPPPRRTHPPPPPPPAPPPPPPHPPPPPAPPPPPLPPSPPHPPPPARPRAHPRRPAPHRAAPAGRAPPRAARPTLARAAHQRQRSTGYVRQYPVGHRLVVVSQIQLGQTLLGIEHLVGTRQPGASHFRSKAATATRAGDLRRTRALLRRIPPARLHRRRH